MLGNVLRSHVHMSHVHICIPSIRNNHFTNKLWLKAINSFQLSLLTYFSCRILNRLGWMKAYSCNLEISCNLNQPIFWFWIEWGRVRISSKFIAVSHLEDSTSLFSLLAIVSENVGKSKSLHLSSEHKVKVNFRMGHLFWGKLPRSSPYFVEVSFYFMFFSRK